MDDEALPPLGRLLKRHRIAAALTQEELAEAAGVSARSISDLERGLDRIPHLATVRRLADALHLEGDDREMFLSTGREPRMPSRPAAPALPVQKPSRERVSNPRYAALWVLLCVALGAAALVSSRLYFNDSVSGAGTIVRTFAVPQPSVLFRPAAIASGRDGAIYALDRSTATIRRYGEDGRLQLTWGGAGSEPGLMWQPGGLAVGPKGEVYVADTGNGRVERFDDAGRLSGEWGPPPGIAAPYRPSNVAVDGTGIVYVVYDQRSRILCLDASGQLTGSLDPAQEISPVAKVVIASIAVGPDNRLYVVDSNNNQIRIYEPGCAHMSTTVDVASEPSAVAVGKKGYLFVIYRALQVVQEFSPDGVVLVTWSVGPLRPPSDIALGTRARPIIADPGDAEILSHGTGQWTAITHPDRQRTADAGATRIAVDARGRIALAAEGSARITLVSATGGRVADTPLRSAGSGRFVGPIGGLSAGANDTWYVSDYGGNAVFAFSAAGSSLGSWSVNSAGLHNPTAIASDGAHNLYVADQGNGRVDKFSPSGRLLTIFPLPEPAAGGSPGPSPSGIAVDTQGNMYVADEGNDDVVKLDPTGRVLFKWGAPGSGPQGLRSPQGIAVDTQRHRLYVADNGNKRLQVLTTAGALIGAVRVPRPDDIAVDTATGHVFILEADGSRVAELAP